MPDSDEHPEETPEDTKPVDVAEASRLSGVSEQSIGDWEAQFGAVAPATDERGEKVYSREDVRRLSAIKSLVDDGLELGEIAKLPLRDLLACLPEVGNEGGGAAGCKLIVVGSQVLGLLNEAGGFGGEAEIVRQVPDFEAWAETPETDGADLIIAGCPMLFPDTVDFIRHRVERAGALRAVVVYEFAKDATKALMDEPGNKITAMRAPVTASELKAACEADLAMAAIRGASLGEPGDAEEGTDLPGVAPSVIEDGGEIPPRRFSDPQLSRISQISTAIQCECPHHLAALLSSLNAFEQYSRECENRNEDDAALHAFLHRRTARARAIMEDALTVLAEAEGLGVD